MKHPLTSTKTLRRCATLALLVLMLVGIWRLSGSPAVTAAKIQSGSPPTQVRRVADRGRDEGLMDRRTAGVIGAELTTETAAVSIEPVTSTLEANETFTVSVVITNVENLGAFQFDLHYDPKVVHVHDAKLGPFLGSSGRAVNPLGPSIDNQAGRMSIGGFSFGEQPGPDGGGVLARVGLTGQGGGETPLDLRNVQVLSPAGGTKPVTVADGVAMVEGKLYLPLVLHLSQRGRNSSA